MECAGGGVGGGGEGGSVGGDGGGVGGGEGSKGGERSGGKFGEVGEGEGVVCVGFGGWRVWEVGGEWRRSRWVEKEGIGEGNEEDEN